MIYLERSYLLEPVFGAKYKFESVKLGLEAQTVEEAHKQVEDSFKQFIELEKQTNPKLFCTFSQKIPKYYPVFREIVKFSFRLSYI